MRITLFKGGGHKIVNIYLHIFAKKNIDNILTLEVKKNQWTYTLIVDKHSVK